MTSLTRNKALVDSYHRSLVQKESEWREQLDGSSFRERKWEQVRKLAGVGMGSASDCCRSTGSCGQSMS